MIKARTPDQSVITHSGRRYTISDAFPTPKMAEHAAEDIRGTVDRGHIVGAICVDLGKDAGRLRYAVFTRRGAKA